ncbi:MAG: hypothetical protein MJZ86_08330 [Bacteroidales bacterium]|nr:hypothetical protein [Bacteroidales bacterium]
MSVGAQSLPYWVNKVPEAGNSTYYYRVTHAEERNYEKAYTRAFAMAVLENAWKMGVAVDSKNDLGSIEGNIADSISIRPHQSKIAINKVCEYVVKSVTSDKVTLYILWQVAAAGNIEPRFEHFDKCN